MNTVISSVDTDNALAGNGRLSPSYIQTPDFRYTLHSFVLWCPEGKLSSANLIRRPVLSRCTSALSRVSTYCVKRFFLRRAIPVRKFRTTVLVTHKLCAVLLALSVIVIPSALNIPKKSLPSRVCSKILYINLFILYAMQAEFLTQIIILDPLSKIIFGYLLFTLKRETEFCGRQRNLYSLAFAMKYPEHQCIKFVSFLYTALRFTFFRGSGKLLNVSVTLSGVRSWIFEKKIFINFNCFITRSDQK